MALRIASPWGRRNLPSEPRLPWHQRLGSGALAVRDAVRRPVALALLSLLFVFLLFFDQIVISISTGHAGVKWRRFLGGTVLDRTFPEGIHLIFPWDRIFIYDLRVQERTISTSLYTKGGLLLDVACSVRYYPNIKTLPLLDQKIGPDYAAKIIEKQIIASVRSLLSSRTPEEVYGADEGWLNRQLYQITERDASASFLTIQSIWLLKITMPPEVQDAIQRKLAQEQTTLAYEFVVQRERREAERRLIEAGGLHRFSEITGVPILKWRALEATEHLATSPNAKVVLMGTGSGQLPVLLNLDGAPAPDLTTPAPGTPAPHRKRHKAARGKPGSAGEASEATPEP